MGTSGSRSAVAFVCAAGIAGCSSGIKDAVAPPYEYGGMVSLQTAGGTFNYASALFIARGSAYVPTRPPNGCIAGAPNLPGPEDDPVVLDVGPQITLRSGATSLLVPVASPEANYIAEPASVPLNAEYDLVIPGSSAIPAQTITGALSMPRMPVVADAVLASSGDTQIMWTPAGSDSVWVSIDAPSGYDVSITCFADDVGHLTIPSALAAAVPAGSGSLNVGAFRLRHADLQGRTVYFEAETSASARWTK